MRLHMSVRVEWLGLDPLGPLDTSRALVFYGRAVKSQVWQVPGTNAWRAISTLAVECICH